MVAPLAPRWTVLYDASDWRLQLRHVSVMLAPGVIFLVIAVQRWKSGTDDRLRARTRPFALAMGSLFILMGLVVATLDLNLGHEVGNEQYMAVVGHIAGLTPGDADGRHAETLVVRSASGWTFRYRYTHSSFTQGFSQTIGAGSPLRVGQCVSIADVGGTIARLAVADQCDDSVTVQDP